jgi:hypothetical protein
MFSVFGFALSARVCYTFAWESVFLTVECGHLQ